MEILSLGLLSMRAHPFSVLGSTSTMETQQASCKNAGDFIPALHRSETPSKPCKCVAQPEVKHILEEKLADEAEEDDEGGPEDPTEYLNHQLKRLRRGKRMDMLRVKVSK